MGHHEGAGDARCHDAVEPTPASAAGSIVSTSWTPARVTVTVTGELDLRGIAWLRTELAGWRRVGATQVRLELSGMTGADPSLARALAWEGTQLREHGGDLIVTGVTNQVRAELADLPR